MQVSYTTERKTTHSNETRSGFWGQIIVIFVPFSSIAGKRILAATVSATSDFTRRDRNLTRKITGAALYNAETVQRDGANTCLAQYHSVSVIVF